MAGNPEFEQIYHQMEEEFLWLAGQSTCDPRINVQETSSKHEIINLKDRYHLYTIFKDRGTPYEMSTSFRQDMRLSFDITEGSPVKVHNLLHGALFQRLYPSPKVRFIQDIQVSINRSAERNYAEWKTLGKLDPATIQIGINSESLTVAQEELLHGAMYITSEVINYPGGKSLIHDQVVHATHASLLMDRILTLAALQSGQEEYNYWYERANENRDKDREEYKGYGKKSLMGLEVNTRFRDPTVTLAQIGLDLKNLEIYFENMHGNDGESEKRRFYTELISLGFGRFHKDWTYQILDTVDTTDCDFERIGKEIVEYWGKPMLQLYKGTPQESEILSHHSSLSEPVGQEYFFYELGNEFFQDFESWYHKNPSYLCSFSFLNTIIHKSTLKKVAAICDEWSKPHSIGRTRQLQDLLDGAGLSWKEFLKLEQDAQAEYDLSAKQTQGLPFSPETEYTSISQTYPIATAKRSVGFLI